jgi:hypothetical protein
MRAVRALKERDQERARELGGLFCAADDDADEDARQRSASAPYLTTVCFVLKSQERFTSRGCVR